MLAILFWFHLMGIAIWVGGSFLMPLIIVPTAQSALEPLARMKFMTALSQRLTSWMLVAILVVVVTGILQTNQIFGLAYLLGVNVLSVKIVVAVVMIANGFYLGNILPKRAAALAPAPGAPPSPQFLRAIRLQAMHGWIQAGLGVVVLLLVGILTAPV
ncbi:MAG TPA: hypothetical protein VIK33_18850 [Anaerolineae bacterium]